MNRILKANPSDDTVAYELETGSVMLIKNSEIIHALVCGKSFSKDTFSIPTITSVDDLETLIPPDGDMPEFIGQYMGIDLYLDDTGKFILGSIENWSNPKPELEVEEKCDHGFIGYTPRGYTCKMCGELFEKHPDAPIPPKNFNIVSYASETRNYKEVIEAFREGHVSYESIKKHIGLSNQTIKEMVDNLPPLISGDTVEYYSIGSTKPHSIKHLPGPKRTSSFQEVESEFKKLKGLAYLNDSSLIDLNIFPDITHIDEQKVSDSYTELTIHFVDGSSQKVEVWE